MSGYQALVSARFRALLQYRSAAIAGFRLKFSSASSS